MLITFSEVLAGLLIIGIQNSFLIAIMIALVDALPVLGAGTVLIPWVLSTFC
jgi:predicted PurR-regulated permease PerM